MPSCRRPWRDRGARSPPEHASSAPPQSLTNARRRLWLPERAASSMLVAATVLRDQYAVALHQPSSSRPSMHSAEMRHSLPTTSGCSRRPCSRRRSRLAACTSETGVLASTTKSARERREGWRRSNRHSCSSRSASSLTAGQSKRPAFAVKGGGWKVARRGGATCMSQASQQVFQPQAGERREGPEASGGAFFGSDAEHRGRDGEASRGLYQPALEHCNSGQRGCDKVSCLTCVCSEERYVHDAMIQ